MTPGRILIIENSIDVTGALNLVLRTSTALRDRFDFIFVIPQKSKASELIKKHGFSFYEIPMLQLSRRWRSILFYVPTLFLSAKKVKEICRRENISVVHVNDFYDMIMPLWRALGGKMKYICHVNFVPDRFPGVLRKFWIGCHRIFSFRIIAVSRFVLGQLPADANVTYIPNALPPETSELNAKAKRSIFLYPANFIDGKGQDYAISAFALISNLWPDWKLRFVGGDMGLQKNKRYRQSLEQQAGELAIGSRIEWGEFSRNIQEEYDHAAAMLNFSLSESFSLTVQEAMFYGCPVIATRSGGPEEIIDTGKTGLLVAITDIQAMAAAMQLIIADQNLRDELAKNARSIVREKFGFQNTSAKLQAIYSQAIGLTDQGL